MQKPPSSPHQCVPKAAGRRTHTLKHFRGNAEVMKMMRRWQRDGGCENHSDGHEGSPALQWHYWNDNGEENRVHELTWDCCVRLKWIDHLKWALSSSVIHSHVALSFFYRPSRSRRVLSVKFTWFKQALFIWSCLQMRNSTSSNKFYMFSIHFSYCLRRLLCRNQCGRTLWPEQAPNWSGL